MVASAYSCVHISAIMTLTHTNEHGEASMVDVSAKPPMVREATASGKIILNPETLGIIQDNQIKKGDVLAVARIAGIQAAKQTSTLIPLCHQLPLSKIAVDFSSELNGITATATVKTTAQTGVEMEALTAVSVSLLTIYDMCKAVDKDMRMEQVQLLTKIKQPVS